MSVSGCDADLLGAAEALHTVRTAEALIGWTKDHLHRLIPHDAVVCSIGVFRPESRWLREDIQRNFPREYLNGFRQPDRLPMTPTMRAVLETRRPQLYEPGRGIPYSAEQQRRFVNFDLRNVAAHGMVDPLTGLTTYLSLNRLTPPLGGWHIRVLEFLMPQVHMALEHVLWTERSDRSARSSDLASVVGRLTPRESQILPLLAAGKTNFEISVILGNRMHTVRTILGHLYPKLDVVNRSQAAAWWVEARTLLMLDPAGR